MAQSNQHATREWNTQRSASHQHSMSHLQDTDILEPWPFTACKTKLGTLELICYLIFLVFSTWGGKKTEEEHFWVLSGVIWKYLNLQLWVWTVYLHNLQWSWFIGLCSSPLAPPPPKKKRGGGGGERKRKNEKKRRQFCMCTTFKKLCAVCVTASMWKSHCAHSC